MFSTQTLDRDAQVSSGETQLKSFGSFLDTYDSRLARLRIALGPAGQVDGGEVDSANEMDSSIEIAFTPVTEALSAFQLVDTDNKILNKVLLTFASLCEEAAELTTSSRTQQMRLLYFDEHLCTYEETGRTEECLAGMSDLLGLLYDVQNLAQRCIMVASMILQQLGAVTETRLDLQLTMQFQEIFNRLGDLILQLITFDEILSSSSLQNFWHAYKKSMHSVARNLNRFANVPYTEFQVNGLVNVLDTVGVLLAGNLFQAFLDSTFKIKEQMSAKALAEIAGHLQDYIRVNLTSIEKLPSCLSEFTETELVIKINAVCMLSHNFLGQLEHKSLKTLMDINAKNIGLTLVGNIMWNPDQFFKRHAPTLIKNYERQLQERSRLRQTFLQAKIQTIPHESRQYCSMVLKWTLEMAKALNGGTSATPKLQVANFKNVCNLLLLGLKYAGQLSHLIKSMTKLHVTLHTKMAKPTLLAICKLIECLQVVQTTFQSHAVSIAQSIQCVLQYLAYKTLSIVAVTKKKLNAQSPSRNERHLDLLAALQIAEKCLYGPPTKSRILIASLALNFANPMRVLTPDMLQKLHRLLNRLELLADVRANIALLCDPSFMYWNQSILVVYLRQIVDIKSTGNGSAVVRSPGGSAASMKYMLRTADKCGGQFQVRYATEMNAKTLVQFRQTNFQQYRQEVAVKQCARIETFLRLNVHENLAQNKRDPFTSGTDGMDDCRELVPVAPVVINGQHVVLKYHIENYLSNMFYNLTTISLHDWRTYSEMRHLANYKFNLTTIEDHLPTQQLEQGIDVLEIMRNIHVFVSKYLYNMNQQLFVEHSSNNKHLNTIGIRHIANSLRTHGSGIINTTVNFTYQFLRKKLYTFSQFLYDEHIKSRLMKDLKYFRGLAKDGPTSSPQMYSYERADSLNKGIRKFGLTGDGQSYLDLFRQLISHIGNALGYIRLMRSGGIHASSNVSVYLPRFDDNLQFLDSARTDELSRTTQNAAENLENNIGSLSRCFSDETEYFKLLVEAFVPFFRDPKNIHLRNFYLIIPALTINFVEYMLNAKDKIHKKDKNGVRFVDDGLAIGLAYLLRLLDQTSEFQSLHWFKSVQRHYAGEREKIQAQRKEIQGVVEMGTTAATDSKLQQTLALTERRINAHKMEFNLLYYDLQSSKIFFQ